MWSLSGGQHTDALGGDDGELTQGGVVGREAHFDHGEHATQLGGVAHVLQEDDVLREHGDGLRRSGNFGGEQCFALFNEESRHAALA